MERAAVLSVDVDAMQHPIQHEQRNADDAEAQDETDAIPADPVLEKMGCRAQRGQHAKLRRPPSRANAKRPPSV